MSDERLARIKLMIGEEGLSRLKGSFVAVVGLGAVGSYVVEGLARSGVGRLRLVDFDEVRASNINRQLYALGSTIGRRKADLAAERALDINPRCRAEAMKMFAAPETFAEILSGPPDLVVDAIDALGPKVGLISETLKAGIPLISSMGAALRTDLSCVRVGPFSKASGCPLAARVRRLLRRHGHPGDFACAYSTEPLGKLRTGARLMEPGPDFYERGRRRAALGSLPTLTGIFGLAIANEAIKFLSGQKKKLI
jgi:tRNA A37 threonylcarbamoyladenosine dehydratase